MIKSDTSKIYILILSALIVVLMFVLYLLLSSEHTSFPLKQDELKYLSKHCKDGDTNSCWILAGHYEESTNKQKYWLNKGIEYNDPRAQAAMANLLSVDNDSKSVNAMVDLLKKSASQNYGHAQIELGCLYLNGNVVKKNLKLAEYWLRKSAWNGNELAMLYLSELLIKNNDEKGLLEAYKWLNILLSRCPKDSYLFDSVKKQQKILLSNAKEIGLDVRTLIKTSELQAAKDKLIIPYEQSWPQEIEILIEEIRRKRKE